MLLNSDKKQIFKNQQGHIMSFESYNIVQKVWDEKEKSMSVQKNYEYGTTLLKYEQKQK